MKRELSGGAIPLPYPDGGNMSVGFLLSLLVAFFEEIDHQRSPS